MMESDGSGIGFPWTGTAARACQGDPGDKMEEEAEVPAAHSQEKSFGGTWLLSLAWRTTLAHSNLSGKARGRSQCRPHHLRRAHHLPLGRTAPRG